MPRWLLHLVVNIPDVQHDISSAFREVMSSIVSLGTIRKFRIFHWWGMEKKLTNVFLCKILQYIILELFCLWEVESEI